MDDRHAASELDFWSFVELANTRLAREFGFSHPLATEVLLTLNRASSVVTYDLEATVHRPRGRSWSGFRLLFVTWLAGPLEAKKAAELTGMSRAAVSNLAKTLVVDGLLERTPGEHDGRSVLLSLTKRGQVEMVEVFRAQNEREHEWAGVLTETEQRILVLLLNKLITDRGRFRGRT
ncbi:MarR family winged helix-turn-helix transcriptional regulator [Amycolatopsis sp. CA-230715]|uniref:MarR family winged helix-turn-helix transcriptional regulator n=1 Tax=Amycolatopsis sp. CA-230715 TaxID=2745196 RepID=UPI0020B26841|nr:MarR family winged helix-turn-helix transcriptional regulator [Amycolatopsis sp. CA-230715]